MKVFYQFFIVYIISTTVLNMKIKQSLKEQKVINYINSMIDKEIPEKNTFSRTHKCNHNKIKPNNKLYSNQIKSKSNRKEDSKNSSIKEYENIRIHFDYTHTLPHERKILEEIIIPPVKQFFESTLKVQRLAGKLRFPLDSKECSDVPIPKHLIDEGVEADTIVVVSTYRGVNKYNQKIKRKDLFGNFSAPLNSSDLITFNNQTISENKFNEFSKNKLISKKILQQFDYEVKDDTPPSGIYGWATYCGQDASTLRPTFAVIQFVSDIDITVRDFEESIWTAIHELTHALGFDSSLFTDYVDKNFNRKNLNDTIVIKSNLFGLQELLDFRINDLSTSEDFLNFNPSNMILKMKNKTIHFSNENLKYSNKANITLELFNKIDFDNSFSIDYSEDVHYKANPVLFNKVKLPETHDFKYIKINNSFNLYVLSKCIENFDVNTKIYVKSENVLKFAKEHYDCNSLDGMPLESNGGPGTSFSHWSKRSLNSDYMIGDSFGEYFISKMTLGLLEDSGWYKIDYSNSERVPWGYKKGCDFLDKPCIKTNITATIPSNNKSLITAKGSIIIGKLGNQNTERYSSKERYKSKEIFQTSFDEFCSSNSEEKCSSSRLFRASCNLAKFTSPIPKIYQNFNSPFVGGVNELGDFCPYASEWYDSNYESLGSCKTGILIREQLGEAVCENCRCFLSTLLPEHLVIDNYGTDNLSYTVRKHLQSLPKRASCMEAKCKYDKESNKHKLYIQVFDKEILCPSQGGILSIDGYFGSIECPMTDDICRDSLIVNEQKKYGYNLLKHIENKLLSLSMKLIRYLTDYNFKSETEIIKNQFNKLKNKKKEKDVEEEQESHE